MSVLCFDAISGAPLSDTGAPAGAVYTGSLAEALTATDSFSQVTAPTTIWLGGFATEVLLSDIPTISTVTDYATETVLAEINTISFAAFAVETLLIDLIAATMSDLDGPAVADDVFTVSKSTTAPKPRPTPSVRSTNLKLQQQPYTPVSENMSDWQGWSQQIARTVNTVMRGGQNVTIAEFTLKAGVTNTILYASQIGATSVITLSPITQSASNEKVWISNQKLGQAQINHSNSAATDRTYRVQIIA
ncbi:MAG TPA: hypothetical protein VHY35_10455 [Stellaceae bacterium]|jgi:hypothetical protein|nr:hypothetical protein [Stellaceae bacterium]